MFIENLKHAWRFVSIQIAALALILQGALVAFPTEVLNLYMLLPIEFKQAFPLADLVASPWVKRIVFGLIVLIILARVIKQPKVAELAAKENPIRS